MADRSDELARKIRRARPGPAPAPVEEPPPPAPKGHAAPRGHVKVTVNLRATLWEELQARADEAGVPPVCLLEALTEKYLASDERARARVEEDAERVARSRRALARRSGPSPT